MKKSKRLTKGTLVEISFLDHVETEAPPWEFVVCGRVKAVDRRSVTVDVWRYADEHELDRTNVVSFTIVRAAITGWWRLSRE